MKKSNLTKSILMTLLVGATFSNIYAEEGRSNEMNKKRENNEHREGDRKRKNNEHREGRREHRNNEKTNIKKQLFYGTINEIDKKYPIKKFFLTLNKNNKELYNDAMSEFLNVLTNYSEIKENNDNGIIKLYLKSEFLEIFAKTIAINYLKKIETNKNIAKPKKLEELLGKIFDLKIKLLELGFNDKANHDKDNDGDKANHDKDNDGDKAKINQKAVNQWIKKRIAVKDEVIRRRIFELLNPKKVKLYRW